MSVLKTDLMNAVYSLSGNKVHDEIIGFVHDMHQGRDYHNLDHVEYCLNEMYYTFEESGLSGTQKCHLIIALCFHDIYQDLTKPVYAVRESARLMQESLCDVLDSSDIDAIKTLILSTGARGPTNEAEFIMRDVDYAILGNKSWNEYHSYAKDIEKEALSQGFGKKIFQAKRIIFLQSLLDRRPTIFLTASIGKTHEWTARRNIFKEIDRRVAGEF